MRRSRPRCRGPRQKLMRTQYTLLQSIRQHARRRRRSCRGDAPRTCCLPSAPAHAAARRRADARRAEPRRGAGRGRGRGSREEGEAAAHRRRRRRRRWRKKKRSCRSRWCRTRARRPRRVRTRGRARVARAVPRCCCARASRSQLVRGAPRRRGRGRGLRRLRGLRAPGRRVDAHRPVLLTPRGTAAVEAPRGAESAWTCSTSCGSSALGA